MEKYKLRIYHTSGPFTGMVAREELFSKKEGRNGMDARYKQLFRYENYSLNPTAWKWNGKEWIKMRGY